MSEQKIKPCPFCGGKVLMTSDMADAFHEYFRFECVHCDMTMTYQYYDKEKAIETFNTRKPMDDIVERLQKRIEHHVKLVDYEMNMGTIMDVERHKEAIKAIENAISIVKGEV